MNLRRFEDADARAVSALIAATLRTTNSRDYPPAYIEATVSATRPEDILRRARWTHMIVACDGETIVGCGAIGPYWDREDESSLFTIFVLPEYQGRGIGRAIVEALERDAYALRARRIEIPASITAAPFYERMGYAYKDGVRVPDGEGLLRMEKRR